MRNFKAAIISIDTENDIGGCITTFTIRAFAQNKDLDYVMKLLEIVRAIESHVDDEVEKRSKQNE